MIFPFRLALIASLVGLPWALSFAPVSWWWLALSVLSLLPIALRGCNAKQWFVFGFFFGLSAYGAGVSWLYISLHVYGGLPAIVAVLALAFFGAYLALFPAFAFYLYKRVSLPASGRGFDNVMMAMLWASSWTFFEWLRGWLFSGFSWLSLGDSLVDSPFNNLLPWFGNHGALWVLLFSLGLLARFSLPKLQPKAFIVSFVGICTVVSSLLAYPPETRQVSSAVVVGIQPNVDQSVKFDPDQIVSNMEALFKLGELGLMQLPPEGTLIFPETVNPLIWTDTPKDWLRAFRDMASDRPGTVITGGALKDGMNYYNAIVQFQGDEPDDLLVLPEIRHAKRHLVPFGERIPPGFHWFVRMLNMPMGEFTPGSGPLTVFRFQSLGVAGTICYEDTFSGEFANLMQQAQSPVHAFLNLSNLAWFQDSWALDQHAQMGRARSSEHRKPSVRVTNTGLSGMVDYQGKFSKTVPTLQAKAWVGEFTGREGQTFFAKYGNITWYCLWGATLMLLLSRHRRLKAYNSALSK